MPRPPARKRRLLILAAVVLLGTVGFDVGTAETEVFTSSAEAGSVEGSVQDAYHPIRQTAFEAGTANTSRLSDLAEGTELLELQAVRVGREAAEPTIGVDIDGNAFFAAGTFDGVGVVVPRTEVLRSTDGGVTWESVQPTLPGSLRSEPPITLDPMVYVDAATGRVFNLELYAGCSYLLISDDDADSWTRSPLSCGNFVNDHQTIISGPRPVNANLPEAAETYNGRWLYYCFNRVADANCGRSLDGGLTWSPTPEPAFFGFDPDAGGLCGGLHGHIATDPDGRLLLPKGHCGTPWIAVSEDGGDSWIRTQVSEISARDIHLSITADDAGNLYFLWWDDDGVPWLSVSRDHGATWEEPFMIAPPGVLEVNFPVIEAGDEGHIAINFPGTTETGDTRAWNQYVVVSENAHTETPLFLSATANDPATDPIHRGACAGRCAGLWDFQDVVIAPNGEAWAAAADDCVLACDRGANSLKTVGDGVAIRQIAGPRLRSGWCETPASVVPDGTSEQRCFSLVEAESATYSD